MSFNVGLHDLDDDVSCFSDFGSCVDACTSRGEYSVEATKEAEAAAEEGEAVDLLEVHDDRKDEATRCDVMTEEVSVPVKGAHLTGWRADRFRQSSGRRPLVSTPLWSLRYLCVHYG